MIIILMLLIIMFVISVILIKKTKKILGIILLIVVILASMWLTIRTYIWFQIGREISNEIQYQREHNLDGYK